VAVTLDSAEVNEYIVAAVTLNKAETLEQTSLKIFLFLSL